MERRVFSEWTFLHLAGWRTVKWAWGLGRLRTGYAGNVGMKRRDMQHVYGPYAEYNGSIWTIGELVEWALTGKIDEPRGRKVGRFTAIDGDLR